MITLPTRASGAIAVLTSLASACSGSSAATIDASVQQDTAQSGGDSGQNQTEGVLAIAWRTGTAYPTKIDHHTSFVRATPTGPRLFVVGGVTQTTSAMSVHAEVRSAAIGTDGAIGAWEDEPALPLPLGFHGQVLTDTHVYLTMGLSSDSDGPTANPLILKGDFTAAGRIATWTRASPMNAFTQPRLHGGVGILDGRLYLVGGSLGQNLTNSVISLRIDADGNLSDLRSEANLPMARSHHTLSVVDGALYLVGGLYGSVTDATDATDIMLGEITDGRIAWFVGGSPLTTPRWTHAAFVDGREVVLIGGGNSVGGGAYLSSVQSARVDGDGNLGTFAEVQSALPVARAHVHHVPNARVGTQTFLYSTGGRDFDSQASLDVVSIGTVTRSR